MTEYVQTPESVRLPCVPLPFAAPVMRVNPGCFYADFTDTAFMDMGRDLHAAGVLAVQHPDIMVGRAWQSAGGAL